ncbi:Bromodomain-containing protein [Chytridium lagenaria]|nr:Bromodomain-containing protein [Chytridium lagenaria]
MEHSNEEELNRPTVDGEEFATSRDVEMEDVSEPAAFRNMPDQQHPDSTASPGQGFAESPAKREALPMPAADNGSSLSEEPAVQGRDITAVPDSEPVPVSVGESSSNDRGPIMLYTSNANGSATLSEQTELDRIQLKYCNKILKSSKRLKDVPPFLVPVDPEKLKIPTYFSVVKHPMDISTIQSKLDKNLYVNFAGFKHDLDTMFNNCYLFNGTEAVVSKMAQNLQKYFTEKLAGLPTTVTDLSGLLRKPKTPTHSQSEISRPKRETQIPARDIPQIIPGKKSSSKKIAPELKIANNIIKEIMKRKYIAINLPFLVPVDHEKLQIPTYPLIVKNPMDLGTISKRLDNGHYSTVAECEADVRLMFGNCRLFNQPGTEVFEMGRKLEVLFDSKWKALKDRPVQSAPLPPKHKSFQEKLPKQEEDSSSSEDEVSHLHENLLKIMHVLTQKKGKKKDKDKSRSKSHALLSGITKPKAKSKESSQSTHKPSKPKKSSTSNGNKRKASSDEDTVKDVTYEQKQELSEKINDLSPDKLETVYDIIRKGVPNLDTHGGQDEIELDIDSLDKTTLYKLYKFVRNSTKKPPPKRQKTAAPKKPEVKPPPPNRRKSIKSGNGSSSSDSSSSSGSDSDSESSSEKDSESPVAASPVNISVVETEDLKLSKQLLPKMAFDRAVKKDEVISVVTAPILTTTPTTATATQPRRLNPAVSATSALLKRPPQRTAAPPPKRRETVDIFSYVTEFEAKKKEEVLLKF